MRLNKNKIARKICRNGLLLSACLLSAFAFLQTSENVAHAEETGNESVTTYQEGAVFVPDQNAQIKIDGETSVASQKAIIKFPDGKAYDLDVFTLNQRGEYEIVYYGEYNGEKVFSSEKFIVTDAEGNVDTNAPTIKVSGSSFTAILNQELSIKDDVEITDDTYYGNLKTAVYFNYGTQQESLVYCENGKFTPKVAGKYSVVYTATDGYGNVAQKVLAYTAKENLTTAITYTEPEKLTTLVACQEYELARVKGKGLTGNGIVNSEISITNPLGETESFKNKPAQFFPEILGEYTITYSFKDNVYNTSFSYTVLCEDTENAVLFRDSIALPHYFIKGASYSLDEYLAYKPTSAGVQGYATEIYVKADGVGEYSKVENPLEYTITAEETLQFKYVYEDKFIESAVIPVQTNVGYGTNEMNYLNYFVGDYASATAALDSFTFTFDGAQSTGTMDFINPLAFTSFNIAFKTLVGYGNFEKLEFILTDYKNAENANKVVFAKTEGGFTLCVNDGAAKTITSKAFIGESFGFWIDASQGCFGTNFTDDDGNSLKFAYNPFDSYLCHLQIKMQGIAGESKIAISKLNNQGLQDGLVVQNPEISVTIFKGAVLVGDEVAIAPMNFNSVFYPILNKNGKVTVTDPNGRVLTAKDGTLLKDAVANCEYVVALTLPGTYLVKYTAEVEVNGILYKRTSNGALNTIDGVAPVVTFDNGANSTTVVEMKVGELHNVYAYKATDNLTDSKDLQVVMVVYNEQGYIVDVSETELAFGQTGTYKVVVLAVDEDGNTGSNSYTIVVR